MWQKAHAAVIATYRLTESFPARERFGLTAQLRRSALSVPTNIVEGSKASSNKDFAHFLNIAEKSSAESGYLFEVSAELDLLKQDVSRTAIAWFDEIERMLFVFRRSLLE